jgi:hypothetical protein
MSLGRLEYKYLVPTELLDVIRADIHPFLTIDQYAGRREPNEYTIKSVYYDTPAMNCYYEKLDGVDIRKKFRIRGYNDTQGADLIFLEIKRKNNNFISKNRAPLHYRDVDALFATRDIDRYVLQMSANGQGRDDARRFFYYYFRLRLSPQIMVVYDREAFFGRFDDTLRITLDKNLRSAPCTFQAGLHLPCPYRLVMPKHFIFELKFYGRLPAWVNEMINRYQLPRLALSKYTLSLDSYQAYEKRPSRAVPLRQTYFQAHMQEGEIHDV